MLNAKLIVIGGAPEGDEFQLELPCIMGRARDSSLPMPHPLVSRRHCELSEREGLLFVRDLGSTNGTFVGSERVDECVVQDNDLLTVGTVTFRAVYILEPANGSERTPKDNQPNPDLDTSTFTRVDTGVVGTTGPKKTTRKRQKAN